MSEDKKKQIKTVSENRKAFHDYHIVERFEAGLALTGSEVKSLRAGQGQLKDSFVVFSRGEAYLQGMHVSTYQAASYLNHLPERRRKLLLKQAELIKLERAVDEKQQTCVPLKLYFKGRWAKVEIAIVKGKKAADKRESIKARDVDRELRRAVARK